jgi:hypothetical protein
MGNPLNKQRLDGERIVLMACLGDYAPMREFADLFAAWALVGGVIDTPSFPQRQEEIARVAIDAASYGRLDVVSELFVILPGLREEVIALLPDQWTRHQYTARAIARHCGVTSTEIDAFCERVHRWSPDVCCEVLTELTQVARPSADAAAATFANVANHGQDSEATDDEGRSFSDATVMERWGFLLPFVDTQEAINWLRAELIKGKRNSLMPLAMGQTTFTQTQIASDMESAARSDNTQIMTEFLAGDIPRNLLSATLFVALKSASVNCARLVYARMGNPPVERFVPAMLDAIPSQGTYGNANPSKPEYVLPLDCSRLKEEFMLGMLKTSRKDKHEEWSYLFKAGAPLSRPVALGLLAGMTESRSYLFCGFGTEIGSGAIWLASVFGKGATGEGLLFSSDVAALAERETFQSVDNLQQIARIAQKFPVA